MKKLSLYIAVMVLGKLVFAQQLPQSSMYMMNNYLLNPGEGGTEDFIDLQAGYRSQWVGLGDGVGPKTFYFSGHSPIGKHSVNRDTTRDSNKELADAVKPMGYSGVGGMVLSDNAGHFKTLEVKASYAYHLPVGKKFYVSFGAFAGIKQTSVDSDVTFDSQGGSDAILGSEGFKSAINPDITLGIWGYHKKYYFGVSSFQVLGTDVKVTKNTKEGKLNRHFYLTGGVKIDLSDNLYMVPSVLIKMLPGVPLTNDINVKFNYKIHYWGGASFRLGNEAESVVLLAGLTLKDIVDIGYAYDINLNGLRKASTGSHEIVLGLRLPNHQHHAPPKQFW